jgi:hypothetical protein
VIKTPEGVSARRVMRVVGVTATTKRKPRAIHPTCPRPMTRAVITTGPAIIPVTNPVEKIPW